MPRLSFGEVFGHPTDCHTAKATKDRKDRACPFRATRCSKQSLSDPLGVCSLSNNLSLTTVCPYRFLEGNSLFRDAGKLVFGPGVTVLVVPEVRILRVPGEKGKKIGKVDYLIGREDKAGALVDFAAIEVQSVYVSGASMRPAFREFLATGKMTGEEKRRPDFRSSAQKRLVPQLNLKVPVFRRWGSKFFVAVDRTFFLSLPSFRRTNSFENSEVTWLVYPFDRPGPGKSYSMGTPEVVFSEWSDVQDAMREGVPPSRQDILAEMANRRDSLRITT